MDHEIRAIYEKGILRPIAPLDLPEGSLVHLHVWTAAKSNLHETGGAELRDQRAALDAMFCEVDSLPQRSRSDAMSGRDHDKILYGSPE